MHNHDNNNSGLQRFSETGGDLFERVTSILEEARKNVVRAVNSNMVIAYWLIGREIVREVQNGDARAEYGKQIIGKLSQQLTKKYKHGFSVTNLQGNFIRYILNVYQNNTQWVLNLYS